MTNAELRKYAELGVRARIQQLHAELDTLRRLVPNGSHRTVAAPRTVRKRRRMSAAARKAVSTRMRAYWAERRKAKGAKG